MGDARTCETLRSLVGVVCPSRMKLSQKLYQSFNLRFMFSCCSSFYIYGKDLHLYRW
jgi:hypothetical protein